MIIIQRMNEVLPRVVADHLALHLRTMPAVVLTGARQLLGGEAPITLDEMLRDTTRLRSFRREYEGQARAGLLLHTGEMLEWLAPEAPFVHADWAGMPCHRASRKG